MSNIWDEEPFSDNPVQYNGGNWQEKETYTPVAENLLRKNFNSTQVDTEEEFDLEKITDELIEENVPDEEEDFTEVLSDARLRLEQGRLYEMVMQHDLFSGLDADPRAVKSVQSQIRRFAKERMEIMLGIKKESAITERLEIDFPFNTLEVDALKRLAHKLTNGASENSDNYVPEIKRITEEIPIVPKKKTLNSISLNKSSQPKPKTVKKAEPIQRKPKNNYPKELELDYEPLKKDPSQMNAAELAQRNEEIAKRQQNKKAIASENEKVRWPTYEETEMMAMQQVQKASTGLSNSLKAVIQQKIGR